MNGFTLVDGVVAAVIVLSAILAYSRGFVREALAIAGWVGAAVLAYLFAASAQPLVKEIPVINKVIGDNCELSIITAFALVFAVGLIIASLFTPLFSSVVQRSFLGGIDQGLGFLFGAVRGIALVAAAFLIYDMAHQSIDMVDKSRAAKVYASFRDGIQSAVPDNVLTLVVDRYNTLTAVCAPVGGTAPAATGTDGAASTTPGN
jgi:membrane protein required for colicin V production